MNAERFPPPSPGCLPFLPRAAWRGRRPSRSDGRRLPAASRSARTRPSRPRPPRAAPS